MSRGNEDEPFLLDSHNDTEKNVKIAFNNLASQTAEDKINRLIYNIKTNKLLRYLMIGICIIITYLLFSDVFASKTVSKMDFNLLNLMNVGIQLSNQAGLKIIQIKKKHKENTKVKGQTKEGVDEPVTVADREANNIFVNGFKTMFENQISIQNPQGTSKNNINIISEESNPAKLSIIVNDKSYINTNSMNSNELKYMTELLDPNDITIIIDPLDATKEFTEEIDEVTGINMLPYVTTLVCFVRNNEPIAGIINRPFVKSEPVMYGIVNTKSIYGIKVKPATGKEKNLITVSRSHTGNAKDIVSTYLSPHTSLPAGGAGYKSWLVLTGKADAYIHVTAIKVWDLCAGHALLKSVGGDITDKEGNNLLYKNGKENYKFKNGLIASLNKNDIQSIAEKLTDVNLDN